MEWNKLQNQLDGVLNNCRLLLNNNDEAIVWEKESEKGQEVVTSKDIAIEKIITSFINTAYPDASILGEESYIDAEPLNADLCFIIDPIDGTKEYLAGRSDYAISIAISMNRILMAGVLDFPAKNKRLWAFRGRGAFENGRQLEVTNKTDIKDLRIYVSPFQYQDLRFLELWKSLDGAIVSKVGALTPKVAAVALGEADAALYFEIDNNIAAIWDYAAAAIILEEAGGVFKSFTGQSIIQMMPLFHKKGWVAASPKCFEALIAKLSKNKQKP